LNLLLVALEFAVPPSSLEILPNLEENPVLKTAGRDV